MIHLTKGQTLFENPTMVVYDPTGYYNDGDSVVCASVVAPEEPVCRYEAKFVAYGGMVYNIADPEKLMEEVIKIDPDNLLGKNNEDVAVDRMVENIQTVATEEVPATAVPNVPDTTEIPQVLEPAPVTDIPQVIEPAPTPIVEEPVIVVPEPIIETPTPTVEQIVPAIENVIEELNQISDTVQTVTDTATSLSTTPSAQ